MDEKDYKFIVNRNIIAYSENELEEIVKKNDVFMVTFEYKKMLIGLKTENKSTILCIDLNEFNNKSRRLGSPIAKNFKDMIRIQVKEILEQDIREYDHVFNDLFVK